MRPVWILQHVEHEPPGLIAEVLERRGRPVRVFHTAAGEWPPSGEPSCAGVVVMGGPMAVYQQARHPWIAPELQRLEAWLARGVPTLGVCLGAQLVAAAAGAEVLPGEAGPEVGWAPVRWSDAAAGDPLCRALGARREAESMVFHWHGDTFTLPPGATPLAASARYARQGFRLDGPVYALQFHFEVTAAIVEAWITRGERYLRRGGGTPEDVRRDNARHLAALAERGARLVAAFDDLLRGREAQAGTA